MREKRKGRERLGQDGVAIRSRSKKAINGLHLGVMDSKKGVSVLGGLAASATAATPAYRGELLDERARNEYGSQRRTPNEPSNAIIALQP